MPAPASTDHPLLRSVADSARAAGVFGSIQLTPSRLTATAANSAEPAEYRLDTEGDAIWVSLVTANRWLSESIESDLMHTGDDLADLIADELIEQGLPKSKPSFRHYRSDDRLFTFRTQVPAHTTDANAARLAAAYLLAYEACFRRLGDMDAGSSEG